jgi:hypothetical protein
MFLPLLVSAVMVLLTVIMHGFGMALLGRLLRNELREERSMHLPVLAPRAILVTVAIVTALFILHGAEIWLYAFFYLVTGATGSLEIAVYFSTISYAGIGFSDHYILPAWRLVAGIEGINGLLLLGWSTAFFVTMIARLGR